MNKCPTALPPTLSSERRSFGSRFFINYVVALRRKIHRVTRRRSYSVWHPDDFRKLHQFAGRGRRPSHVGNPNSAPKLKLELLRGKGPSRGFLPRTSKFSAIQSITGIYAKTL